MASSRYYILTNGMHGVWPKAAGFSLSVGRNLKGR